MIMLLRCRFPTMYLTQIIISLLVRRNRRSSKDAIDTGSDSARMPDTCEKVCERLKAELARLRKSHSQMEKKAEETAQRETHQATQLRAQTQNVYDLKQQLASLYTAYQMLQKEYDKLERATKDKQAQQEEADFSTAVSLHEIQKKQAAAVAAEKVHRMQLTEQQLKFEAAAAASAHGPVILPKDEI